MLAVILVVGLGEELWVRFVPQYLGELGGGVWVVAAYGAIYNLLDALYQYPGGWLADRFGRRTALTLFTLMAAGGYALYLGVHWAWVLAGTCLVMAWDTLTLPALFAVVGDILPPDRRAAGFAWQSIVRRTPTIVAPPLGGFLITAIGLTTGVRVGLVVTIGCCVVAVLLLRRYYQEALPHRHEPARLAGVWRTFDGQLRRLLVADILARWAEGIPKVFVVIYCLADLRLSALEFGWLMAVQRLTNLLVYLPLLGHTDRLNRKPFVLATFTFFALFPVALANANGFPGAALAFVVAGLWEVGEPARKALIMDLANEAVRGRAVGLYYFLRNLSLFPATFLGGLTWQTLGPTWVFYLAALTGAVGCLFYAAWGPGNVPAASVQRLEVKDER